MQIRSYINICIQITFIPNKSVTDKCLVSKNVSNKWHQFLVQKVLFITLTNPLHVKEVFKFYKQDGLWQNLSLVQGHVYFPFPPPPPQCHHYPHAHHTVHHVVNSISGKIIV
jgi:hypothetical protein